MAERFRLQEMEVWYAAIGAQAPAARALEDAGLAGGVAAGGEGDLDC